jgi:hypothetical protein
MFTFDRKPRPTAVHSPASKPISPRPAQAPPGNPLWFRLAARAASEADVEAGPSVPVVSGLEFARIPVMPPPVQRKATVSSPGDPYEREADEIAARVVRATGAAPAAAPAAATGASIQRKCAGCEDEERGKIQTKAVSPTSAGAASSPGAGAAPANGVGHGGEVPPGVLERLGASHGSPLPAATRKSMSQAFGFDFSRVRVHTGSDAAQVSRDLHARAFTWGSDIY